MLLADLEAQDHQKSSDLPTNQAETTQAEEETSNEPKTAELGDYTSADTNDDEQEESPLTKKIKLPNFSKHKNGFRDLCAGLKSDGRVEPLLEIINKNSKDEAECFECRPFFLIMQSACKSFMPQPEKKIPLKKPKKSHAENHETEDAQESPIPTATPEKIIYKQREPSLLTLKAVAETFHDLSLRGEEAVPSTTLLLKLLRDPRNRTKAEIDYYDILTAYMEEPLKELFDKKQQEDAAKVEKPSADEIFAY